MIKHTYRKIMCVFCFFIFSLIWDMLGEFLYYTWDKPLPPFSFLPPFVDGVVGYGRSACNGVVKGCFGDYYKIDSTYVRFIWLGMIVINVLLCKKMCKLLDGFSDHI